MPSQLQSLAEDLQLAGVVGQMDGTLCSSGEGGTDGNNLPMHTCMCGSAHNCGCVVDGSNNNTHEATIALLPSTMHPQSRAEPHTHAHTGKSLPSVPPSPEERNLPSLYPSTAASCRSSAKD